VPGFDPANPWSLDPFAPPNPGISAPQPFKRAPKLFPEQDRLFQVQSNTLKAVNDVAAFRHALAGKPLPPHADAILHQLERNVQNSYRVIRSYLDKYVNAGEGGLAQ